MVLLRLRVMGEVLERMYARWDRGCTGSFLGGGMAGKGVYGS